MLDFEVDHTIAKIKNGERNGFVVFFNQTFQYMFTRAKYLFPNNVECRHFLASAYHDIYMNINDFSTSLNLESWLSSRILTTYNQILKENQIDAFAGISNPNAATSLGLENAVGVSESLKGISIPILTNYISKMPSLPKIVSLAFYHDGLQTSQIAESLDCPEIYISWELGKAKEFLQTRYANYNKENRIDLYPLSLSLIYASFDALNEKYTVTKEYAALVWETVSSDLKFKKSQKKKTLTMPVLFGFSILVLAFLLIKMFGGGSSGLGSSNSKASSLKTQMNHLESDTSSSLLQKPKSTTTIKDANGTVKTYDENGSEISTSANDTGNSKSTSNSSSKGNTTTSENSSNSNSKNSSESSERKTSDKKSSGVNTSPNTKSESGQASNNSNSNTKSDFSANNSSGTNGNSSSNSSSNTNVNSSSNSSSSTNGNSSSNNSSNGSSNSSTKNAASNNSKAASSHTVTAPSVNTPTVNTPSVSAPTVNTPTVNTPSVSSPATPTP